VSYHLDFKKYPKSVLNNFIISRGLGMILVTKTNSINQKNYIGMFTTSILRCMKKNQILAKTFDLLSSI
jgi:hypothetical protein